MAVPSTDEWRSIVEGFRGEVELPALLWSTERQAHPDKGTPQHRIPVPQLQGNFFLSSACCWWMQGIASG